MRIFKLPASLQRATSRPTGRPKGRHRAQRPAKKARPLSPPAIVAAVALGLLVSASVAPGPTIDASRQAGAGAMPAENAGADAADQSLDRYLDPALLEAVPVGPQDVSKQVEAILSGARVMDVLGQSGIPEIALEAYQQAEDTQQDDDESCGVRWTLLAAIGRVESNHGRFGGAMLREDGYGTRPIRGIPLDGRPNVALIRDTDRGALDGDTTFDRAVGPMQFIPSTWRSVGVDGNADTRRDPNNMYDAAEGAAVYLCAGDGDLRDQDDAARAVRRYNNADEYVQVVLRLAEMYESGRVETVPYTPIPLPADTAAPPAPAKPSTSAAPAPPARPKPSASTAAPKPTDTTTPTSPAPTRTPPTPSAPPTASTDPAPPSASTDPAPPSASTDPAPPTGSTEPTPPGKGAPTVPAPPDDPPDTAAVGWAPAMRDAVITVLGESKPPSGSGQQDCPDTANGERAGDQPTTPGPSRESDECVPAGTPPSAASGRDGDGG